MTRSRGRPRSEPTRRAILAASLATVEEEGYAQLTMEGLARRAGVSKQTIYRWWPTKAAVVLEALIEGARRSAPQRDTGSFEADLRRLVRDTVSAAGASVAVLSALMAEAQLDERFGTDFREGFLAGRRAVLREVIARGRERDQVSEDADPDVLIELVFGMLWYRILTRHAPLNRRFADQLTAAVLALASPSSWNEREAVAVGVEA